MLTEGPVHRIGIVGELNCLGHEEEVGFDLKICVIDAIVIVEVQDSRRSSILGGGGGGEVVVSHLLQDFQQDLPYLRAYFCSFCCEQLRPCWVSNEDIWTLPIFIISNIGLRHSLDFACKSHQ